MPPPSDRRTDALPAVCLNPGELVESATIRPPGSKSLTNRHLIMAALADQPTELRGGLDSDDTRVMIAALRQIGIRIDANGDRSALTVDPRGRGPHHGADPMPIHVGNSGTSIRFLTAALAAITGHYRLIGVDRMHARPIGDLVEAIRPVLDGQIECETGDDCPPVRLRSRGIGGGTIRVAGDISSQYLSGLMMAAVSGDADVKTQIEVSGDLVSEPYVRMTAEVMRRSGATVSHDGNTWSIGGRYIGGQVDVEPDASAATYPWAAAAITGCGVTVTGLDRTALQGDVGFVDVLNQMGCDVIDVAGGIRVAGRASRGVDVDMNAISDTVQSLAPVALFADGPTRVRGVAHNRFKETDRIGDLATELRRVGAQVDEHDDGMTIHPLPGAGGRWDANATPPVRLRTYDDHRMAMGLALIGLRRPNTWIEDPACTAKTYPEYWWDLETLTRRPHRWTGS